MGLSFTATQRGPCPSTCQLRDSVLLCHDADAHSMLQLTGCVNSLQSLSVVDLRSDLCFCSLLDYIRITQQAAVITFTPKPCGQVLLQKCRGELPEGGRRLERPGVVAGLIVEQKDPAWREAAQSHLSWLRNQIHSLNATIPYRSAGELLPKSAKTNGTKMGLNPEALDRIVPFRIFQENYFGPLYGRTRPGWQSVQDFVQAVSDSSWLTLDDHESQSREEVVSADEDVNHKESDEQGKDRSPDWPLVANFDETTVT